MSNARELAELSGSYGTGGFVGMKNRIINGAMQVWQRATTGTSGYTSVDRWQGASTATFNQSSDVPAGFKYSLSFSIASAAYVAAIQNIESVNATDLVGNNVTVSFWAKSIAGTSNLAVELLSANSSDNFAGVTSIAINIVSASPSSSWTQYTTTFSSLPSGVANGLQVRVARQNGASASTTLITGVQLEKGSTATSFDIRPYGTEVALCQRYYQITNSYFAITEPGTQTRTTGSPSLKVNMRAAPTVSLPAGLAFHRPAIAFYAATSVFSGGSADGSGYVTVDIVTGAGTLTSGQMNNGLIYSAEL